MQCSCMDARGRQARLRTQKNRPIEGRTPGPEFLAINPAGLVPVLITLEGDALYEVAALMVYLADRHQLTELAPAVTDPQRCLFLSAVFHIASDIQSEMKRFHFPPPFH